ncbi:hypothetical protein PTKIN_Ptkin11bG0166600 [Pterospermum kingtungense]
MLVASMDNSSQRLPFIDAVQRSGVSYHFEKRLQMHSKLYTMTGTTLRMVSMQLPFDFDCLESMVLMSHVAFKKFKDEEGNFKSSLTSDVRGLLELYEASYTRVHGEEILNEAISFATTHLTLSAATLDYPLSEQVAYALKQSIRRGLSRVEARKYIPYTKMINPILKHYWSSQVDFN